MTNASTRSGAAALADTARRQAEAADPEASVWVSANAGTGKTHVLTMRVLRLMLSGTAPERILCLTYTKAAAAEMSKRVFGELAKWVTQADHDLVQTLVELLGRKPAAFEIARARTLFTATIETPGGLKVQTIHAFAERLLKRFPLEAGVPPGFDILDDTEAITLRRQAINSTLAQAAGGRDGALAEALKAAITYAAGERFDEILTEALKHREWLDAAIRLEGDAQRAPIGLAGVERLMRRHFGVRDGATRNSTAEEIRALFPACQLERIRDCLRGGGKTDFGRGEHIATALAAASPVDFAEALHDVFFKSDGDLRDKFLTKRLAAEHPDIEPTLSQVQPRYAALYAEMQSAAVVSATMALHRLAIAVLQRYSEAKARRAALDFEDLIDRTRQLLIRSNSVKWTQHKLDGGIEHILVDESQDTSPNQWSIIENFACDLFSMTTASTVRRTLFAVGDEKQSIYSFQGAKPEMFSKMGNTFESQTEFLSLPWRRITLDVSFRTVTPVLEAVDAVFADPTRTRGVPTGEGGMRHIARRVGQAGSIEIWPSEAYVDVPPTDAWSPLEEGSASLPVTRLAARIADTIGGWIGKRILDSQGRPIRAGDILILVRKRRPFAGPMVAALKARGIPVAGADRIQLTEHIAVQDLLSLGDFLTLPEDDLALAEVLKSPIFDLDDDDLLAIAHGRRGTLWKALLDNRTAKSSYAHAADMLKRWRKAADFTPPFEFWASLLERDGVRKAMLAQLGPDAADPLDEFLNLALTYDDGAPPSLPGFMFWLRDGTREIKRDMEYGRDEVRIMTVHGAKGLEAPIVFLPDTCSAGASSRQGGRPIKMPGIKRPDGTPAPFVWPVTGKAKLEPIVAARTALAQADTEERHRLLYVAMTRARDHLVVAGFEGKRGREPGCWYDLIAESIAGRAEPVADAQAPRARISTAQTAPTERDRSSVSSTQARAEPPAWVAKLAPREPQLTVPLAPSRLAPYETDDTGEPVPGPPPRDSLEEPVVQPPATLADQGRFLRGTLTHALLEHLPSLPAASRETAAKTFVKARGHGLTPRVQTGIVKEAFGILNHPVFAPLFAMGSRAEVAIVAEIPRSSGHGPALRLTGQIDRLAVTHRDVLIVDYKTNRPSPREPEAVADVYLYQLAAYRLAIEQIYPGRTVRAAILWTDGPHLMEIPAKLLSSYAARLWDLDVGPP